MAMKLKNFLGELGAGGLILIFICSGTIVKSWVLDNDAWFILNCGRYVLANGIPHTEFATIHEGLHYVMEQWLTAVIFWKIYSGYGADALIDFCWLTGAALMWLYYKLCLYVSGNQKISAILAMIVSFIVIPLYVVTRPQIFSTLILLVEVFLLEKFFRERKIWALAVLPVLSVILVNLHAAMWPMMIIVLLPFLAESLILEFQRISAPVLPLVLTALGIFLAGFLNPYGWEAMIFIFTSYDPSIHKNISEMQAPSADAPLGILFFAFAVLLIVAYSRKNLPWRYFFLTFGLMILGSQAYRAMLLFLILGAFPLAFALKERRLSDEVFLIPHKLFLPLFIVSVLELWKVSPGTVKLPLAIFLGGAVFFLLCFIFFYRREGKLFSEEIPILRRKPLIALVVLQMVTFSLAMNPHFSDKNYEVYKPALDFLLERERAEDIILWTGFNSGGYAEFRGVRCYMDARPEIFAKSNNRKEDIVAEYFALREGRLYYTEFFARYNFTHVFVTEEDFLVYSMLSRDENYRQIFEYDFDSFGGDTKIHGRIFECALPSR